MSDKDYKLIFADGTEIQFASGSTPNDFIGIYASFADVDAVRTKMTEDNLKGATFNGVALENVIPLYVRTSDVKYGENIEVHFVCTVKSAFEIMQEQITELQEALAEIVG